MQAVLGVSISETDSGPWRPGHDMPTMPAGQHRPLPTLMRRRYAWTPGGLAGQVELMNKGSGAWTRTRTTQLQRLVRCQLRYAGLQPRSVMGHHRERASTIPARILLRYRQTHGAAWSSPFAAARDGARDQQPSPGADCPAEQVARPVRSGWKTNGCPPLPILCGRGGPSLTRGGAFRATRGAEGDGETREAMVRGPRGLHPAILASSVSTEGCGPACRRPLAAHVGHVGHVGLNRITGELLRS
jgi:hypothetical protein